MIKAAQRHAGDAVRSAFGGVGRQLQRIAHCRRAHLYKRTLAGFFTERYADADGRLALLKAHVHSVACPAAQIGAVERLPQALGKRCSEYVFEKYVPLIAGRTGGDEHPACDRPCRYPAHLPAFRSAIAPLTESAMVTRDSSSIGYGKGVICAGESRKVLLKLFLFGALRLPLHVAHRVDDNGNFGFGVWALASRNGDPITLYCTAAGSIALHHIACHECNPPVHHCVSGPLGPPSS